MTNLKDIEIVEKNGLNVRHAGAQRGNENEIFHRGTKSVYF